MATSPAVTISNSAFAGILPSLPVPPLPLRDVTRLPQSRRPGSNKISAGNISIRAGVPAPVSSDRIAAESIVAASTVETQAVASTAVTLPIREQVLVENLPLVRFVARRIHERLPQHVELDDLVSAGTVGLIDAYSKFDAKKNVQFRSYAQFRIRGAILDSLRSLDWGSRELRRQGRSVEEALQRLTQRLGRKPSETEVAADLDMELSEYQELLGSLKNLEMGSLQDSRNDESAEEELACLATPVEEDPFHLCVQSERSSHLTSALKKLPEREARVLSMYYMEEMTLKEIGLVLGLVESRVSQIRAAAIVNLRSQLSRRGLQANSARKREAAPVARMPKRATRPMRRNARPAAAVAC